VVGRLAEDGREAPGGAHWGRGPRGYRRTDQRILEDVSDRLTDDPYVDASEIEVTVRDGEVTFAGSVGSRDQRRRAEDIAERVLGVTHVQNNLRVRSPERAEPREQQEAMPAPETATPAAPAGKPAERTVTALFDTLGDAHRAADDLAGLGITRVAVTSPEGGEPGGVEPTGGLWGFLTGLFASDADRQAYAEGVRRGGVLLTATVGEAMAGQVTQILRQAGAVDLQARAAEWRASGWRVQEPETGGSGV
jgi:hypothetical protein